MYTYDSPERRYQSDQFVMRLGDINRRMDEIRDHAQQRLWELEQRRASTPPPRMGSPLQLGYRPFTGRYGSSGFMTPPPRRYGSPGRYGSHGGSGFGSHGGSGFGSGAGSSCPTKALIIGINYRGTPHQLAGCVNDAKSWKAFLQAQGWNSNSIRMITDEGGREQPTQHTIVAALRWLVQGARPGDSLFFSYSGHGKQMKDLTGEEKDGLDEVLVACDGGAVKDDDLFANLVAPLPAGVRLTCVIDCCHSGTILDLPYSFGVRGDKQKEGNKTGGEGMVIAISGCRDEQTTADIDRPGTGDGGAFTQIMLEIIGKHEPSTLTWRGLLEEMHWVMAQRGFSQRPMISSNTSKFDTDYPVSMGVDNGPLKPISSSIGYRSRAGAHRFGTPYSATGAFSPFSSPGLSSSGSSFGSPGSPGTRIRSRAMGDYFGGGGGFGDVAGDLFGGDAGFGGYGGAAAQAFMNDGKIGLDDAPLFAESALSGTPYGEAAAGFNSGYGQGGDMWGGGSNMANTFVDNWTGNDALGNVAGAAVSGFGNDWKMGADDFTGMGNAYTSGGGQWGDGALGGLAAGYADDGQLGFDDIGNVANQWGSGGGIW
eukprot:TRINITY_DN94050_c0_g1_i1.p1 TRINITY_DN94050_c0_g1~~TRINITY_DN94050_c0_g1_i1.p1  ORF type:complete len:595 (-),score=115.44 TRINITY_DN94050_c0_g1_i1:90-1874(-)